MKIQIEIPNRCEKCPCFAVAERKEVNNKTFQYHICRAFNRILEMNVDLYRRVQSADRCEECIAAEVEEREN